MGFKSKLGKKKVLGQKLKKKPKKSNKSRVSGSIGIGDGTDKFKAITQITRQVGYAPFGMKYMAKLPYCEDLIMSTAANSAVIREYRLNGCFDPRVALLGHQPRWWDQLTPLYNKYRVTSANVSVTFHDPSSDGVFVGLNVYDSAITNNSISGRQMEDIRERKLATVYPVMNTGKQSKTLNFHMPISKILGLTEAQYNSDVGTEALVIADPVKQAYLQVFVIAPTTGITPISVSIKITYNITFFGYNSPAQS